MALILFQTKKVIYIIFIINIHFLFTHLLILEIDYIFFLMPYNFWCQTLQYRFVAQIIRSVARRRV